MCAYRLLVIMADALNFNTALEAVEDDEKAIIAEKKLGFVEVLGNIAPHRLEKNFPKKSHENREKPRMNETLLPGHEYAFLVRILMLD